MNRKVCVLNGGQACEISGFLLQKAVNFLKLNGYTVEKEPAGCDTLLVNSCVSVDSKRADAEEAMDAALRGGRRRVLLFGCLAAVPNKYKGRPGVIQVGPKDLGALDRHFKPAVPVAAVPVASLGRAALSPYQRGLKGRDRYVLIAQGCVNSCSYCTIKKVKGMVASRAPEEILRDVRRAAAGGGDVTLLADDCGSYGADLGTDLPALLSAAAAAAPGVRFKISTLHPAALLRYFARLKPLFAAGRISYVNIPIQSGSRRVLGLMERRYDIGKVLKAVRALRALSPSTWTYTHVIVNFPTETRADLLRSLKASLAFNEAMYINYSANRGTRAGRLKPRVGRREAEERLGLARALLDKGQPGTLIACGLGPGRDIKPWRPAARGK